MNSRDYRFMKVAKSVSETSTFHGPHIGCCVVYKNQVISVAANSEKTHPLQEEYNRLRGFDPKTSLSKLHAEIRALLVIRYYDIDWSKVTVYTYRATKGQGIPANSKPCNACEAYMKYLGVSKVCYVNSQGKYEIKKLI